MKYTSRFCDYDEERDCLVCNKTGTQTIQFKDSESLINLARSCFEYRYYNAITYRTLLGLILEELK